MEREHHLYENQIRMSALIMALFGAASIYFGVWYANTVHSQEVPLVVTINQPQSGETVEGDVGLDAGSSARAAKLDFIITEMAGGTEVAYINAEKETDEGVRWLASWDSSGAVDGLYSLTARAEEKDRGYFSSAVPFTVQNGIATSAASATTTPTLTLESPSDGDRLKDIEMLKAQSDIEPDQLRFLVGDSTGANIVVTIDAAPHASISWEADWDTRTVPNGQYSIFVAASYGEETIETPAVSVTVDNEIVPPVSAPVVVMHYPDPGTVVSGTTPLVALADGLFDDVEFVVSEPGNANATTSVSGVMQADEFTWQGDWDTTKVADGSYEIIATGTSDGDSSSSPSISLTVDNASVSAPTAILTVKRPQDMEKVSGSETFEVTTSVLLDSSRFFILEAYNDTTLTQFDATYAGEARWRADFDSTTLVDGLYRFRATGVAGSDIIEGRYVPFNIENGESGASGSTSGTTGTSSGNTTTSTSGGGAVCGDGVCSYPYENEEICAKDCGRTDDGAESAADYLEPTIVMKTPEPGDVLTGLVRFEAVLDDEVEKLEFMVGIPEQDLLLVVVKGNVGEDDRWFGSWDSTRLDDGEYKVGARAEDSEREYYSEPISVEIKNGHLSTASLAESAEEGGEKSEEPKTTDALIVCGDDLCSSGFETAETCPKDCGNYISKKTDSNRLTSAIKDVTSAYKNFPLNLTIPEEPKTTEESGLSPSGSLCANYNIEPGRCLDWLEARNLGLDDQCIEKGYYTREACEEHLIEEEGGVFPGCGDKTEEECRRVKEVELVGLINDRIKSKVDEAVHRQIRDGIVLEMPGMMALSSSGIRGAAWIRAAEDSTGNAPKGILVIDTDKDGLPDDLERTLNTAIDSPDSDGDGASDREELQAGRNPVGEGEMEKPLDEVKKALVNQRPLEQPRYSGTTYDSLEVDVSPWQEETDEPVILLTGSCDPGATCLIYIYSYIPTMLVTEADENGNWSYELRGNSIVDGVHTVYVAVTDDLGKIKKKSGPLSFFVREAQAITFDEFIQPDEGVPFTPAAKYQRFYGIGAILIILFGIALSLGVVSVTRATSGDKGGPLDAV